ncbi:thiol-disulfide oxidoreductase DCC family protein [Kribbella catacumbae]|uniref:thiol-disulfide oxidoreductase DCC family protein n=1 Tax=Kribbella catacumbae TaxID=460086 RepID=UPI00036BAB22|nr:DCC1-like thiol-disulfide oxidoreductase family protein [Kribbella catacumbae]
MQRLVVLYDAHCGLCRRFKEWLAAQKPAGDGMGGVVRLGFVAAGSTEARRLYPALDHAATLRDVTVVADDGSVYVGDRAWIVCLWATGEHRATAVRLSAPAMRPVARAIVQAAAGLRSWNREWTGGDYADGCDGQCDRQG